MEFRLHNLVLSFVASVAILIVSTFTVSAEIENKLGLKFYGSFLYTEKVPNALFFFSDIEKNDSFALRKALRNHDIEILVLSSKGGSVWEGLSMAAIINDRELITYVPELGLEGEGNCASACAFMFFGGSTRVADGKLGVHQFYSGSASESAKIGTTQKVAQFTVSEIIGFLNEFKTPPFVYERMFQQSEMYYFDKKELGQIARVKKPLEPEDRNGISNFINDFKVELASLDVDEDPSVTEPVKKVEPKKTPTPKKKTPVVTERTKPEKIKKPSTSGDILVCDNAGKIVDTYENYTAVKIFDFPQIKEASRTGDARGLIKYCFKWGCGAEKNGEFSRSGPNNNLVFDQYGFPEGRRLYFNDSYSTVTLIVSLLGGNRERVVFQDCNINNNYKVKTTTTKTKTVTVQEPVKTKVEIVKGIQTELNRLNCNAGTEDGIIGNQTKSALKRYASASGKVLGELLLTQQWFLSELETTNIKCPIKTTPKIAGALVCDRPVLKFKDHWEGWEQLGIEKVIIWGFHGSDSGKYSTIAFLRTPGSIHKVRLCSKSNCWDEKHKYEYLVNEKKQYISQIPLFQPISSNQGQYVISPDNSISPNDLSIRKLSTRTWEKKVSRFMIADCR